MYLLNDLAIHTSITFKTLTIGYFVIGTEIWNQVFRNPPPPPYKKITKINAFATRYEIKREKTRSLDSASLDISSVRKRISKLDLLSFSEFDNSSEKIETERMTSARWAPPRLELFTEKELRQIEATIKIIDHKASRTEILSYFVCFID